MNFGMMILRKTDFVIIRFSLIFCSYSIFVNVRTSKHLISWALVFINVVILIFYVFQYQQKLCIYIYESFHLSVVDFIIYLPIVIYLSICDCIIYLSNIINFSIYLCFSNMYIYLTLWTYLFICDKIFNIILFIYI